MMENDRGYRAETPMLEVRNLSKQYKGFLLDKVSFTLPKGYIMGYVGPNGAGKSTTLGLITQTRRADEGEILLDGKRCYNDEKGAFPAPLYSIISSLSPQPFFEGIPRRFFH